MATTDAFRGNPDAEGSSRAISKLGSVPSLRERVHDEIERLIIVGTLQPGQRLVETELAESLGVSRGPVREALYRLQREGWVDLTPRFGAVVHTPSSKEIDDFFHMRIVLEAEASRLAAERMTEEEADELDALIRQVREAHRFELEMDLVRANSRFHERISRVAGNDVLYGMLDLLDKRSEWYAAPMAYTRGHEAWDEHAALVEAIRARDPERAATVMRQHITATHNAYKQLRS